GDGEATAALAGQGGSGGVAAVGGRDRVRGQGPVWGLDARVVHDRAGAGGPVAVGDDHRATHGITALAVEDVGRGRGRPVVLEGEGTGVVGGGAVLLGPPAHVAE